MAIDKVGGVGAATSNTALGGVEPSADVDTPLAEQPVALDGGLAPADRASIAGVDNQGLALPVSGAPAARRVDVVKLASNFERGSIEMKLHLRPGAKLAGAEIPEQTYAVVDLVVKANGELDFAKCTLRFENAKGERMELDRDNSIFDVRGGSVSADGRIQADITWSFIDIDVTESLLGVEQLPTRLSDVLALVMDRAGASNKAARSRVIDTDDVSYSGFFSVKPGTLELAGRSRVELHEKANIFVKGNTAAGMVQLNTAERGASLALESVDGNGFTAGPSTLNLRVGFKAEDNARFFMFHDSVLNDARLTVKMTDKPVSLHVKRLVLDGHDQAAPVIDPRWLALEQKAEELGVTVPPSEAQGADVERLVIEKFVARWPLSDLAEAKPEVVAKLLKDPQAAPIPGLYGLFRSSIVEGTVEGLEQVPYFIRERLQAMPEDELTLVVQRALLADVMRRYESASAFQRGEGPSEHERLAALYADEVADLKRMLEKRTAATDDPAKKASLAAALERLGGRQTSIEKDLAVVRGVSEELRPSPELPPYDAFAYLFERDGTLDRNFRDVIMPALLKKVSGKVPASGEVKVDELALKPGVQPVAVMALSHPLVKQAMRDPKVRAVANEARRAVEKLAGGFTLMRLIDVDDETRRTALTRALAAQQGVPAEQVPAAMVEAILADPAQHEAVFERLRGEGRAIFEQGKAELRGLFVRLGGMEPNGRAEALGNLIIDEVKKSGIVPEAKARELEANREKLIGMAVNTARAAVWIRVQPNYRDWGAIGAELLGKVAQTDAQRTTLGSAAWMSELEALTGAELIGGNRVESPADGPAFFSRVKQLIEATPKPGPIYVNYWAIYDDVSGRELRDLLIAKHRQGWNISVMVDGKTATDAGLGKKDALPALEAAGIPVVLWNHPAQPPVGNHVKYIATPAGVITGGSNIGDAYTHAGTPESKWSDSNVAITGPAVKSFFALHEAMLAQAGARLPFAHPTKVAAAPAGSAAKVALIHERPADLEHPILLATMKMLEGARPGETVHIKNAYFVLTEPLRLAIERAIERGVNVEVFTNSPFSIDEPVIAKPIMDSAREVLRMSERARAKLGAGAGKVTVILPRVDLANPKNSDHDTVHDKITLAGDVSAVMTYNMHPRSETLEHEIAAIIVDPATARAQKARWDAGVAGATKLDSSSHPLFTALTLDYKDLALELFKDLF